MDDGKMILMIEFEYMDGGGKILSAPGWPQIKVGMDPIGK
jgi:hypothetical protein